MSKRIGILLLLLICALLTPGCSGSSEVGRAAFPTTGATVSNKVPKEWPYRLEAPPVVGEHGMVVTDATLATAAGLEMLKAGGNAIDATIARSRASLAAYDTLFDC